MKKTKKRDRHIGLFPQWFVDLFSTTTDAKNGSNLALLFAEYVCEEPLYKYWAPEVKKDNFVLFIMNRKDAFTGKGKYNAFFTKPKSKIK